MKNVFLYTLCVFLAFCLASCSPAVTSGTTGVSQETTILLENTDGTTSTSNETTTSTHELSVAEKLDGIGIGNVRDLGGYQTTDGKVVRNGMLFRSAYLTGLSEDGINLFQKDFNLYAMIDFRDKIESAVKPDPEISGATQYRIDVTPSTYDPEVVVGLEVLSDEFMLSIYHALVTNENIIQKWREFFDVLLEPKDGAVIYHCYSGADRTGVATALIYGALNVPRESIIEDYNKTARYTKPDYIKYALDTIDQEYGSMHEFLTEQIGLTDSELQNLRDKYTE